MVPAIYDTISADISVDKTVLMRATGSVMKFAGFLAVYEEKVDEEEKDEESKTLPNLQEGQKLKLLDLISEQAFTRPPPRYTEASLVKELEKLGIGRPSTYASIMNKIQGREYTLKESGRFSRQKWAESLLNCWNAVFNVLWTSNSRLQWKIALNWLRKTKKTGKNS